MRINPTTRVPRPGNSTPQRTSKAVGRRHTSHRARLTIRAPLLHRFENYLHQHTLSPATIRNYLADLRAFSRWHNARGSRVSIFSSADCRAYRDYLCNDTDHSPATVNRHLQSLRLFGRFLHETGQVDANPTQGIELLRNGNGSAPVPRTLTRGEIARLLDALRAARPNLAQRDHAIVQLMLQAGLRVHEIAALEVRDVLAKRRGMNLVVRGSPRSVPLNPTAVRALRDYLAARPAIPRIDDLFVSQRGQPLSVRSIQRVVDTYARAAGLAEVSAQALRHTCAKTMLEETRDTALVARWLGCRNTKTLNRYAGRA